MERKRTSEKKMPVYDDGWWASILAEEEHRAAGTVKSVPKQAESLKPMTDWVYAQKVFDEDEIVIMTVTGYNRGGLLVEGNDLYGFVPCSHLVELPYQAAENRREECLTAYLGRAIRLKVIECVPDEGRMVFSERAARTEAGKRPALFNTIEPGQQLQGEVTNVTDFGAFVDLGGVEGLIHISELSWGRVAHPSQICQVGQRVEVLVLDITPERCRIALSLKRLQVNPWETAQERYPVSAVFPAVVTALVPFGAFARLEEGLEGLIHASEMELPPNGIVRDLLKIGQEVRVRILLIEPTRQRLGLSMKID